MPDGLHSQCWTLEQEIAYARSQFEEAKASTWGKAYWLQQLYELQAEQVRRVGAGEAA